MLSYRHGFHAGNPADVFKHAVLLALIDAMQRKPRGISFLDTHAGPARYDLTHAYARKNREFERGIAAVWNNPPTELADYVAAVHRHNPDGELTIYPGSPQLFCDRLRPQDRLTLSELHPAEQKSLAAHIAGSPNIGDAVRDSIKVIPGDGYESLAAIKTPDTGRGLVLIDPPYELKSELDDLGRALDSALRRFGHGVYTIWYPVIEGKTTTPDALPGRLGLDGESWLDLRIRFREQERLGRMTGCGMALINPPWSAREALAAIAALWPVSNGSIV